MTENISLVVGITILVVGLFCVGFWFDLDKIPPAVTSPKLVAGPEVGLIKNFTPTELDLDKIPPAVMSFTPTELSYNLNAAGEKIINAVDVSDYRSWIYHVSTELVQIESKEPAEASIESLVEAWSKPDETNQFEIFITMRGFEGEAYTDPELFERIQLSKRTLVTTRTGLMVDSQEITKFTLREALEMQTAIANTVVSSRKDIWKGD